MKCSYFLASQIWCLPEFCAYLCLQSDDECCNSCEDVREAYRKKGWALSNPDLIDQVCPYDILTFNSIVFLNTSNTILTNTRKIFWCKQTSSYFHIYVYRIPEVPSFQAIHILHIIYMHNFLFVMHLIMLCIFILFFNFNCNTFYHI